MSDDELKPCPFCGGNAVYRYPIQGGFCVVCTLCFCSSITCKTEEHAQIWWNRRNKISTADLVNELASRDGVIRYPKWVSSKEIFKNRITLPGNKILLEIVVD